MAIDPIRPVRAARPGRIGAECGAPVDQRWTNRTVRWRCPSRGPLIISRGDGGSPPRWISTGNITGAVSVPTHKRLGPELALQGARGVVEGALVGPGGNAGYLRVSDHGRRAAPALLIKCGRNGHRTLTVSESGALDRHDVVAATPGATPRRRAASATRGCPVTRRPRAVSRENVLSNRHRAPATRLPTDRLPPTRRAAIIRAADRLIARSSGWAVNGRVRPVLDPHPPVDPGMPGLGDVARGGDVRIARAQHGPRWRPRPTSVSGGARPDGNERSPRSSWAVPGVRPAWTEHQPRPPPATQRHGTRGRNDLRLQKTAMDVARVDGEAWIVEATTSAGGFTGRVFARKTGHGLGAADWPTFKGAMARIGS